MGDVSRRGVLAAPLLMAMPAAAGVRTAFDFVASNPERGRRSQGTGNLELGVSFVGKRPLIVGETSRVTRRRIGATTSSEDPDD